MPRFNLVTGVLSIDNFRVRDDECFTLDVQSVEYPYPLPGHVLVESQPSAHRLFFRSTDKVEIGMKDGKLTMVLVTDGL